MSTQHTLSNTEEDPANKHYVPLVLENPELVKVNRKQNKRILFLIVLSFINIGFAIFSLSIIYGNQSQIYRKASVSNHLDQRVVEVVCATTAESVADKVVDKVIEETKNQTKEQNVKQSKDALKHLNKAVQAIEARKPTK